ncbi:MAG: phosphatase PAP2 family protein [Burkholderiaceae bacterium]
MVVLVAMGTSAWADSAFAQTQQRSADFLSLALPAATLGVELIRGDREGAWQYVLTFAAATSATEVLKRVTRIERPDRSNRLSFPSGHAARAFSAAAYLHRRHGLDAAWPAYLAALYVGYLRVATGRHRWVDVAGSAAISVAAAWWLATPAPVAPLTVTPVIGYRRIGVQVSARW